MASLSATTRAEDLFASAKIDHDAVLHLAAFWATRLEVGQPMTEGESALIGAVASTLVGSKDVDDLDCQVSLSCGISMGIGITLAILEDPIGDPRERLTAAILAVKHDVAVYAEAHREDLAMVARRDAKAGK